MLLHAYGPIPVGQVFNVCPNYALVLRIVAGRFGELLAGSVRLCRVPDGGAMRRAAAEEPVERPPVVEHVDGAGRLEHDEAVAVVDGEALRLGEPVGGRQHQADQPAGAIHHVHTPAG